MKKLRKLQCKCHGVSGSCTLRTCWLSMQDFRLVAAHLKTRYNGATHVMMAQDGNALRVADRNHKKPTRSDLVYLEASPDFCVQDSKVGEFSLVWFFSRISSAMRFDVFTDVLEKLPLRRPSLMHQVSTFIQRRRGTHPQEEFSSSLLRYFDSNPGIKYTPDKNINKQRKWGGR